MLRNQSVFVVDDDLGMLKGLTRLLRQHGYDSVGFSSAEEFQNHGDFESACCVVLDINLNNEFWNRTAASSQGGGHFTAGDIHHSQ